jgi:predicted nucleic acid-binding protein
MKRIYLDSNVFISFAKQELGRGFRLLGSDAENFFRRCSGKVVLVISDYVLMEIKKIIGLDKDSVCEIFSELNIQFELVGQSKAMPRLEHKFYLKGVHYPDSLHAAFAVAYNCEAIITFNKKDFLPASSLISVLEPLELAL